MSSNSRRLQTLRALTAAAKSRSGLAAFNHVDHELQEIGTATRVSPQRRSHLLQVFHGMRALESALKEVARSHGLPTRNTLGGVFYELSNVPANHPAHLSARDRSRFLRNVASTRNSIMHQANKFPRSEREVSVTMGEIAACFSLLVR